MYVYIYTLTWRVYFVLPFASYVIRVPDDRGDVTLECDVHVVTIASSYSRMFVDVSRCLHGCCAVYRLFYVNIEIRETFLCGN